MQRGFPADPSTSPSLLARRRCAPALPALHDGFAPDGTAQRTDCAAVHRIRDGVLSLLEPGRMHPESAVEMSVRDGRHRAILDGTREEWRSRAADELEMLPTLDAVGVDSGMTVCELGCGPGWYTLELARRGRPWWRWTSRTRASAVLRRKLAPEARVALVQADVTRPYGAAAAFDRVLSTLHSNLPDRDHRLGVPAAGSACSPQAAAPVVSMHHYNLRDRVMRCRNRGRTRQCDLPSLHDDPRVRGRSGAALRATAARIIWPRVFRAFRASPWRRPLSACPVSACAQRTVPEADRQQPLAADSRPARDDRQRHHPDLQPRRPASVGDRLKRCGRVPGRGDHRRR